MVKKYSEALGYNILVKIDRKYLTMAEAAKYLGVGHDKMWRLVRDGELRAYRSGADRRRRLVRKSDLESVLRPSLVTV